MKMCDYKAKIKMFIFLIVKTIKTGFKERDNFECYCFQCQWNVSNDNEKSIDQDQKAI